MAGGVDSQRIRERLGYIGDCLRKLRELGELPRESYLADYRNTSSARYLLVTAAEAAIDICNHLVARLGARSPSSYAECFLLLGELGIIESALAEKLQGLARFRNLLVHVYADVDDGRVYDIMQDDLVALDDFRTAIARWLSAKV